ncbi:MAG: hypothetical protein CL489_16505 [Acidobacteria bacterium]|nr:hypothetical protein [Acidobacteriota bacterium]|tara:strand:+ start:13648 stop:13956 length:309 start_codon:yes stop_codon:yes gene_type:complete
MIILLDEEELENVIFEYINNNHPVTTKANMECIDLEFKYNRSTSEISCTVEVAPKETVTDIDMDMLEEEVDLHSLEEILEAEDEGINEEKSERVKIQIKGEL